MTPDEREDYLMNENQNTLPPLAEAPGSVLPCPFCGGEAKIFTRDVHDTTPEPRRKLYWYVCSTYGCGVGRTHGEWNEPLAREKWNRRVPPNSEIRHGGPGTPELKPQRNPPLPASNG